MEDRSNLPEVIDSKEDLALIYSHFNQKNANAKTLQSWFDKLLNENLLDKVTIKEHFEKKRF